MIEIFYQTVIKDNLKLSLQRFEDLKKLNCGS